MVWVIYVSKHYRILFVVFLFVLFSCEIYRLCNSIFFFSNLKCGTQEINKNVIVFVMEVESCLSECIKQPFWCLTGHPFHLEERIERDKLTDRVQS